MIQKWTRPVETLLPCEFKMNVLSFQLFWSETTESHGKNGACWRDCV